MCCWLCLLNANLGILPKVLCHLSEMPPISCRKALAFSCSSLPKFKLSSVCTNYPDQHGLKRWVNLEVKIECREQSLHALGFWVFNREAPRVAEDL